MTAGCGSKGSSRGSEGLLPQLGNVTHRWSGQVLDTSTIPRSSDVIPATSTSTSNRRLRPRSHPRRGGEPFALAPDHRRDMPVGGILRSARVRRFRRQELHRRERHGGEEFRRIHRAGRIEISRRTQARARRHHPRRACARSRRSATTSGASIGYRQPAPMWAAICTGIRWSGAGIAPATARISPSTERHSMHRRWRHWSGSTNCSRYAFWSNL